MEEKDEVKTVAEETETMPKEEPSKKIEEKVEDKQKLTDDELYTKIQTEKMLKNQKIKKISLISALSLVFALAVVIICLASIPLNLKPQFLNSNYVATVVVDGQPFSGALSEETNSEEYKVLKGYIDNMFTQTYFSGLFNGTIFGYDMNERDRQTEEVFKSSLKNYDYVEFEFLNSQTIKNKDGSVYVSTRYPNSVKSFSFEKAYMILSDDETSDMVTFYFIVQYVNTATGEALNEGQRYAISMTTRGDTYPIYEHFNPDIEE